MRQAIAQGPTCDLSDAMIKAMKGSKDRPRIEFVEQILRLRTI